MTDRIRSQNDHDLDGQWRNVQRIKNDDTLRFKARLEYVAKGQSIESFDFMLKRLEKLLIEEFDRRGRTPPC